MRVRVFNIILCFRKSQGQPLLIPCTINIKAIRLQMTVPIFMDGSADSPVKTEESKPVPLISLVFRFCDFVTCDFVTLSTFRLFRGGSQALKVVIR